MQVLIDRAPLLKATGRAQGVVERRTTIPILQNVLISAEGGALSMRATDLDVEIVESLPAEIAEPGVATVSAHTLHEIVRKLPDGGKVSLTTDGDNGLTVAAGRSRFALATLPKDDFPMMASSAFEAEFRAPSAVLRALFDKARFAISTEETRYYLNGVYLHVAEDGGEKRLRAVATDGHRLARIDADLPDGADGMSDVIVPRKTVGELRKILDDDDQEIAVAVSETKIRFSTNDVVLVSKVIDGSFPDYTRVIPSNNALKLEVSASRFAKAVDRVATVSSERTRAVKLSMEADRLVLSVNSPETGSATEELDVAYDAEPLEIGFNAKYLQDIADQIGDAEAVFLFSDPGSPTLVREGEGGEAIYVVMPMRV